MDGATNTTKQRGIVKKQTLLRELKERSSEGNDSFWYLCSTNKNLYPIHEIYSIYITTLISLCRDTKAIISLSSRYHMGHVTAA